MTLKHANIFWEISKILKGKSAVYNALNQRNAHSAFPFAFFKNSSKHVKVFFTRGYHIF